MIRLGCCIPGGSFMPQGEGGFDGSALGLLAAGCRAIKNIGYDFAEASVGMLMNLGGEEYARAKEDSGISIEAANSFIPGSFRICAPDGALYEYADKAMERVAGLGGKILVFGSGAARRMDEGLAEEKRRYYIFDFLKKCDTYAQKNGLAVVLEPLNTGETNIVNTVAEGAAFVREAIYGGCKNIKLLADSYHMSREPIPVGAKTEFCESGFDDIAPNADILAHTHTAEPGDRTYPGSHGGAYVRKFIAALKSAGYGGRLSVECGYKDFLSESAAALRFLRSEIAK